MSNAIFPVILCPERYIAPESESKDEKIAVDILSRGVLQVCVVFFFFFESKEKSILCLYNH